MLNSQGANAFKLAYELSPIFLVGGIAENIPGNTLPIVAITEGLSFVNGILKGSVNEPSAAHFMPIPGTTLINQDIAEINFFNQITAANSTIQRNKDVSMQMVRPVSTTDGGYATKGLAFLALKSALERHNEAGGWYNVLTPACLYTGCLLKRLIDVTPFSEENKQVQFTWRFEFTQPALTQGNVSDALNGLFGKIRKGVPFVPDGWSFNGDLVPNIPAL